MPYIQLVNAVSGQELTQTYKLLQGIIILQQWWNIYFLKKKIKKRKMLLKKKRKHLRTLWYKQLWFFWSNGMSFSIFL